ncbi:chlorophyllase [Micromonospora sp. WMMD1102]|uniref:alpha/beta hydrolase family protein n=1 Tax=Micromonospora sp. WMMD1102 TaxID=3016105 RepID=UPI0024153EA1|nr:chlorophyllase [Micromonospora sp. WMMD1102]MDG4784708.1 chlorophyllase [Micromonospora sp. WMMD1102]
MFRRPLRATLAAATATTILAASLAGCSTGSDRPAADRAAPPERPTPGATAPTSPALAGVAPGRRFAVGVRELSYHRGGDRRLPVTVWYPAAGAAGGSPDRGARVAAGRFPLVLFSHGLTGRPSDYRALLTRWAAAGFVVVAPRYPHTSRGAAELQILDVVNQPADASFVLTRVLALNRAAGDPLRGRLAVDRVAAAGHSAGGVTTIGLFTVGRDVRLDAGIVLAGTALGVGTGFTGTPAPQLFVHGERDDVVSYQAGKAAYDRVPWPKAMMTLPDGDHRGALLGDDEQGLDVVADTTVEFLRWTLYGDDRALRRLPDQATRGGLASLDDRL